MKKRKSSRPKGPRVVLRRDMIIGSVAAENDSSYLSQSFVEVPELAIVSNTEDHRSVLLGRTGSGKSALLRMLEARNRRVIRISPEALSLHYISNSTILPYLAERNIHLDLFYKWLWRHVIVLALINTWDNSQPEPARRSFIQELRDRHNKRVAREKQDKRKLIDYTNNYGTTYWQQADIRVKEIAQTLTDTLEAELGADFNKLLTAKVAGKEAFEEKVISEVVHRAQDVVNETQIHELNEILDVVEDRVLSDPQKPFYIVIDDLDKDWVDEKYAYDLIDALLDEVAYFSGKPNVKIVVALRQNVAEKLNNRSKQKRGAQREKRQDLFLHLRWDAYGLIEVLKRRLSTLQLKHNLPSLHIDNVLPPARGKGDTGLQFILQRTTDRPRDVISFMNHCFAQLGSKGVIDWDTLHAAERAYSQDRLRAFIDEWNENFPGISIIIDALRGMPDGFEVDGEFTNRICDVALEGERGDQSSMAWAVHAMVMLDERKVEAVARDIVVPWLYQIGVLGIKLTPEDPILFVHESTSLSAPPLLPRSRLYFHPSIYKALAVSTGRRSIG